MEPRRIFYSAMVLVGVGYGGLFVLLGQCAVVKDPIAYYSFALAFLALGVSFIPLAWPEREKQHDPGMD